MGYIILDKIKNNNKKMMIFIEGTILKPKHNNFFSRINMTSYVPIGGAVEKIRKWQEEGYEIIYLTSLGARGAMKMARHIDELGFTGSMVGYRQLNQTYNTLFKEEMPDIFIEDNCKSIGENFMVSSSLDEKVKDNMKTIIVDEFKGIDDVKLY